MNWTVTTKGSMHCFISYPEFHAENKKEEKAAARMNSFYSDIISAAVKKSEENGLKYYMDISARTEGDAILTAFNLRIRDRGRTVKNTSAENLWRNGVIVKAR